MSSTVIPELRIAISGNQPLPENYVFALIDTQTDLIQLRDELTDHSAGGYVSFEGWVRDHNEGQQVLKLAYEAYPLLANKEGGKIVHEAMDKFEIIKAACVHRTGLLEIGELAVWVGVSSAHRDAAFSACRYIIDEIKVRVPIWKKEYYVSGDSGWVDCEECAKHGHVHSHGEHR
ncbi:MAG: molybdenum cofactor biosynthesis protein MoaE [Proteobacteria bacterium]|nr:molybdenum cofactor biosynthesis protein MoaE [Pseudomonadota bacterium]